MNNRWNTAWILSAARMSQARGPQAWMLDHAQLAQDKWIPYATTTLGTCPPLLASTDRDEAQLFAGGLPGGPALRAASCSAKMHPVSAQGKHMTFSPETTRRLLWAGAIFGAIGLLINGIDWWQSSLKFAAPKLIDQLGMLLLVGAALPIRLSASTRMMLVIVALILIVPSTALIVVHAL